MNHSHWSGEKVCVRAWEPSDWQAQARWHQDTEGSRRTGRIQLPLSGPQVQEAVEGLARRKGGSDDFRGIIGLLDGSPVGVIGANDTDRDYGTFSIAYYVEPDHRRKGYCSEAVLILLRHYFMERRYQKANAAVYDFNVESRAFLESLGFQFEGRQRRMHFTEGEYSDLLHYGLTSEEFLIKYA